MPVERPQCPPDGPVLQPIRRRGRFPVVGRRSDQCIGGSPVARQGKKQAFTEPLPAVEGIHLADGVIDRRDFHERAHSGEMLFSTTRRGKLVLIAPAQRRGVHLGDVFADAPVAQQGGIPPVTPHPRYPPPLPDPCLRLKAYTSPTA